MGFRCIMATRLGVVSTVYPLVVSRDFISYMIPFNSEVHVESNLPGYLCNIKMRYFCYHTTTRRCNVCCDAGICLRRILILQRLLSLFDRENGAFNWTWLIVALFNQYQTQANGINTNNTIAFLWISEKMCISIPIIIFLVLLPTIVTPYETILVDNLGSYHRIKLPSSVIGAESLAFDTANEGPYVGVADGRVLKWNGHVQGWTSFAVPPRHRYVWLIGAFIYVQLWMFFFFFGLTNGSLLIYHYVVRSM